MYECFRNICWIQLSKVNLQIQYGFHLIAVSDNGCFIKRGFKLGAGYNGMCTVCITI